MIKISIVSTFFNDKEMLKLVLDSVLSQTYSNIEHVVTDGGSSDGSVELLKEYESKYVEAGKQLVWVSEKDKGIYDGANKGFNMASGDYMIWGSDPYSNTQSIAQIVNAIEQDDFDYVYGGLNFIKDGKIIRAWSGKPGYWRLGWMAAHPTLCYKKELWAKYGPYDVSYKSAADYKFQIQLFKDKTLKHTSILKPLVNLYAGGTSNNGIKGNILSIKENFRIMKECKVAFGWFTVICKIVIAIFAYTFNSHKKVNMEEKS